MEIRKQNLFRASRNTLEVNGRLHKWKNVSKFCEKCMKNGIETEDTLEHLLVECDHYKQERKNFEKKIVGKIGEEKMERHKRGGERNSSYTRLRL